jgi:DNA-binding CsgD family transcriptional regulator
MRVIRPRKFRSRRVVGRSVTEYHNRRWSGVLALQALEQLRAGVILVDSRGRVIDMNCAAKSIVGLEDGLLIRDGLLCARRVFETAKMSKLIAGVTTDGKWGTAVERMLVGRRDCLPAYVVTVTPLSAGLALHNREFAMIVVVDPERHSPSEKDLAELFGLSPAEARLAVELLTGKTLSDIGANCGARVSTLRTQLSSIMRKVGAERQSDLIRILSGTGIGSVSLPAGLDMALCLAPLPLWLLSA